MLNLNNLDGFYGEIQALHDISLTVCKGEVVALLGANGAGKTTMLKAISGLLLRCSGSIVFEGQNILGLSPDQIVRKGIVHVPEGRKIFKGLTALENLTVVGDALGISRSEIRETIDKVMQLFPNLKLRIHKLGWSLSGGEQQMLAIGRGLMARPRLLMLDEPSLGLSPLLVQEVFGLIREINTTGTALLVVEQNAAAALTIAHRGYVLETGEVVLSGDAESLVHNDEVRKRYLGL